MNKQQRQELIAAACDARQRAFAKYSNFPVGAAVLTSSGDMFVGCNVENASYGLTICAERVAMATAVATGQRQFQALAIASSAAVPPCGACRQFAAEFCDDLLILLIDSKQTGRIIEAKLSDLLPNAFRHSKHE